MKKIIITLLITTFACSAFAQEFTVNGEVKTGLFYSRFDDGINEVLEKSYFHSRDDAGNDNSDNRTMPTPGRFQIDMAYLHNNVGFKVRFRWESWLSQTSLPFFNYAFGYGNFFQDQLTLSIGKLGASPWGTGGPEMWKELEISTLGGIRLEVKPKFLPVLDGLNVGFVLNYFDGGMDSTTSSNTVINLGDYLQESVIGISYTNDLFHARLSYRLDSERDFRTTPGTEGGQLVYRIEEYMLKNLLPDLSLWALGYYEGIGAEAESYYLFYNWLFAQYDPDNFTAQIRLGFDVRETRNILHIRPSFYYKFFANLLNTGISFSYAQDFGDGKMYKDSPYAYMEVEPKVQVNLKPNAYVAFAYNYRSEYGREVQAHKDKGIKPIKERQWVNLRFCIIW